jgi:pimeloyl-ACP methyl ester carboxylesterase
MSGMYLPIMERMLRADYATFSWDRPGTGESTGEIDRSRLIEQRAQILLDAIAVMKARADIDPRRIGLVGISQAGYVMPRVLSLSKDIAFMICTSCPGMAGNDQTAYVITFQALCAGVPEEKADQKTRLLSELDGARTYETYAEYVHYREILAALTDLAANPDWSDLPGVVPEEEWRLSNPSSLEGYWNPMEVIEKVTIPVLAFFGEKDTQVDPIQGARAYREALERAGNPNSRVALIAGADHAMTLAVTGCMDELQQRVQSGDWSFAPEYLDTLEEWLRGLRR